MRNITIDIDAKDLKKKLDIKDGKDAVVTKEQLDEVASKVYSMIEVPNPSDIAIRASKLAQVELEKQIPTIPQITEQIPVLGEKVRDSLELLSGVDRLARTAIEGLDDYDEVARLAREPKVVEKIYTRGGGSSTGGSTNIEAGTGISIEGAGTEEDPKVISAIGGGFANAYLHTQSSPSTTWVVAHDLSDSNPLVGVKVAGEVVEPESITIDSANQLTITFGEAVAGTARILGTGATAGGGLEETFETVSKNLKGNPYVLNYTGTQLTSMVYTLPASESITKTFGYTGTKLTSITLSGNTPAGIDLVKTLSYTGDSLTGITYS